MNITPPASPVFGASAKSGRRSTKRIRTEEETIGTKYSNQGYIQIKEASTDGTFVKLFNSGAKVSNPPTHFTYRFSCSISLHAQVFLQCLQMSTKFENFFEKYIKHKRQCFTGIPKHQEKS